MCSICKDVLTDFGIVHTELMCPLRNSRYCSNCAKYGHLTKSCPAKPLKMYTDPMYLEQLISAQNIKDFNIVSKTPINHVHIEEKQELLEIKDNELCIITYLKSQGIKVKKGAYKTALENHAQLQNKRLVYVK